MNFLLLQINDSLFPIGGYTHSFGLESYVQLGTIKNQKDAREYLISYLHTQFLYTDMLGIKLALESKNVEKILELESFLYAASAAEESRNAMQKIGIRFIKTLQITQEGQKELFLNYAKMSNYFLYPICYGVFCKSHHFKPKDCIKHYIYTQISSTLTNCVKLIPLAQGEGQKILMSLHKEFDMAYTQLETLGEADFCAISPHQEIKAMQHENLYPRLYMP